MSIKSTAEFQDADEASEACEGVALELNEVADQITEGDYASASTALDLQIKELQALKDWVDEHLPEETT